jgi:hypothetical protein
MTITSAAVPPDTDEFELANIAKDESQVVIPYMDPLRLQDTTVD